MVGVAQSVELWIVAPAVAGSNPVAHPIFSIWNYRFEKRCGKGAHLLCRAGRIGKTRTLPILAVSANAMEKDIKSCLSAGFTDYIVKPINIPKFLEKIDKLLT